MNDLYGPGLEICFLCSWPGLLWEMHVCVVGKHVCAAVAGMASSYLLSCGLVILGQAGLGCGHTGSLLSGFAAGGELKAKTSNRRFARTCLRLG